MARKTQTVTISAEGRDSGKVYLLTEMAASAAERWATRALLAIARAGIDLPPELDGTGMAGVHATGGFRLGGSLHPEDVEPLMDDMMACIQRIPDPTKPEIIRALVEDDIEEVATRFLLRGEVMKLHMGFLITDGLSTLGALVKRTVGTTSNTETPLAPSAPSSPPASPA